MSGQRHVYSVNYNIRVTAELAHAFGALCIEIRAHNGDPNIAQADLLRAVFQRGVAALQDELRSLQDQGTANEK